MTGLNLIPAYTVTVAMRYRIFFVLTAVSLWLPGRLYNLLPMGISCVAVLMLISSGTGRDRSGNLYYYLLLFYLLLVAVSGSMHYAALRSLALSTYITIRPHTAEWGIMGLRIAGIAYILLPAYLFILIEIFHDTDTAWRLIPLIPIVFIPSLLVALYQEFFDIRFLNTTITYWLQKITGLSSDFNGFRISLFLLMPLSILGAILHENRWVKIAYTVLTSLLLATLCMSRSRTGILGIALFTALFPAIVLWVRRSGKKPWVLYLLSVLTVSLILTVSAIYGIRDNQSKSIILDRINQKISFLETFGLKETLRATFDENSFLRTHAPSRIEMGGYALILTASAPLSGWGPGGFIRNIDNIRYRSGMREVGHKHIDNANNHYLQMSSELGLFGALLNIVFHLLPLWMVWRIRNRISNIYDRWATGIGFAVVGIMLVLYLTGPHIISIDILWIFTVYLSYLFATSVKYGYTFKCRHPRVWAVILIVIAISFSLGTYDTTFGERGYQANRKAVWWPHGFGRNHYAIENWKEGPVIWCRKDATIEVPLKHPHLDMISLKFRVLHPDIESDPVQVMFGGKNGIQKEITVTDHLWKTVAIPFTAGYLMDRQDPERGYRPAKSLILTLDVSRTWVPKDLGVNDDERELGIAVLIPEW